MTLQTEVRTFDSKSIHVSGHPNHSPNNPPVIRFKVQSYVRTSNQSLTPSNPPNSRPEHLQPSPSQRKLHLRRQVVQRFKHPPTPPLSSSSQRQPPFKRPRESIHSRHVMGNQRKTTDSTGSMSTFSRPFNGRSSALGLENGRRETDQVAWQDEHMDGQGAERPASGGRVVHGNES